MKPADTFEPHLNDPTTATLKSMWVREWLIVASFVLISAYGFWAIWQPQNIEQDIEDSAGRASPAEEDKVAADAAPNVR